MGHGKATALPAQAAAWGLLGAAVGGVAILIAIAWVTAADQWRRPVLATSEVPSPRRISAHDVYPETGTAMPDDAGFAPSEVDQAPSLAESPSSDAPAAEKEVAAILETQMRLEKGDTFGSVLRDLGFAATDVGNVIEALGSHVSMKRLKVGQVLDLKIRTPGDEQAAPILLALTIRPEPRRQITLERDDEGEFGIEEVVFEVESRMRRAEGTVDGSVIASAELAGVPRPALAEMLRAFAWDVNFQHDIKEGDRFAVLVEQSWTSDGLPVDGGRVLWAEITTGGGEQTYSIYRFKPRDGVDFFYNREGWSVIKALLRTPLSMERISSGFGWRRHPILKFTRMHTGIDFAAPTGTPILAAGTGRVLEAGRNGGYGRWIKIEHDGGVATAYAHLSRIAAGIRRSARVRQGQVIGFVGSSGLSTGPHLHFELHRNGLPVNPLTMARTAMRQRLSGDNLARFERRVAEIDRARATADVMER
jgi:murein DD-endopeptidase MepM/ murein hydrolase activator NlpD